MPGQRREGGDLLDAVAGLVRKGQRFGQPHAARDGPSAWPNRGTTMPPRSPARSSSRSNMVRARSRSAAASSIRLMIEVGHPGVGNRPRRSPFIAELLPPLADFLQPGPGPRRVGEHPGPGDGVISLHAPPSGRRDHRRRGPGSRGRRPRCRHAPGAGPVRGGSTSGVNRGSRPARAPGRRRRGATPSASWCPTSARASAASRVTDASSDRYSAARSRCRARSSGRCNNVAARR